MGRGGGDGVQLGLHHHRLQLQPLGGRALLGAERGMVVEDLQHKGIFPRDDLIENRARAGADGFDALLPELAQICHALFFAHDAQHMADEAGSARGVVLFPDDLVRPLLVEQILVCFRTILLGHEIGVHGGGHHIVIGRDPITIGVLELRRQRLGAFKLRLHDGVDFQQGLQSAGRGEDISLHGARLMLAHQLEQIGLAVGAGIFHLHAIFRLETGDEGPHDLIHDQVGVIDDLAFLFRLGDQLRAHLLGARQPRSHDHRRKKGGGLRHRSLHLHPPDFLILSRRIFLRREVVARGPKARNSGHFFLYCSRWPQPALFAQ